MSAIRILLIEPDPGTAAGFCTVLRNQLYDVDTVAEGSAGQKLLARRRYDLIVLESDLPDMSGCDLCEGIREEDEAVPVIMLASGERGVLFECFAAGADDHMQLPVDDREFLARIRALVRRTLAIQPVCNRLRTGDIVMDLDTKLVFKAGREVLLTANEFMLLEYMMQNKNKIVSKGELVACVWGEEIEFGERKVTMHIGNLRQKLNDGTGTRCLYTVTGKGYILTEK